jgi:YggT family protein
MFLVNNFIEGIAVILNTILTLYFWIVIASAILSWVNPDPYNPIVRTLRALTEPVFFRIRRMFPFLMVGGIDLSPIAVLLIIQFLKIFAVGSLYQMGARLG